MARTKETEASTFGPIEPVRQLGKQLLGLSGVEQAKLFLGIGAPRGADGVDVGEDHEPLGSQRDSEHRRRAVLVDHGVDSGQPAVPRRRQGCRRRRRRPRSSPLRQRSERRQLDDLERCGRGDDAPPASAGVLDDRPAALALELLALLLRVERPDRLGRLLEGGVVLVDAHVRQQAGDGAPGDAAASSDSISAPISACVCATAR